MPRQSTITSTFLELEKVWFKTLVQPSKSARCLFCGEASGFRIGNLHFVKEKKASKDNSRVDS